MFEIIVLRTKYVWGNSNVALFYCPYNIVILLHKYSVFYNIFNKHSKAI